MRRLAVSSSCALLLCFLIPAPSHAGTVTYGYQTVISPGDPNFDQLLGINNASTIAGYYGDGAVVPNNGFTLVLPNSFTAENYPGSAQTQVIGINNTGETVGFYTDAAGVTHGFTFSGGTFTTVDAAGTAFNQLLGVNNSGEVAGYSSTDPTGLTLQMAYTEKGGVFTSLTSLLPSGILDSQATDVNNSGWTSGFYVDSAGVSHGFLIEGTTVITLNFPGAADTTATGLNNTGLVDGFYVDSSGNTHGFVYNIAAGTFAEVNDPNGLNTTFLNGINDQGQLVGFYTLGVNSQGVLVTDGFVASPTPEPASLILIGTGLLGLMRKLRKRA